MPGNLGIRARQLYEMRAAAVDLGKVRVGLAVADELGLMAHPRPHLDGRNRRALLDSLAGFAETEGISLFLVGLPRTLGGREGPPARRARRFATELGARTGLRVELVDERLTTKEARARLQDQGMNERQLRSRVDSAAAAVLLQAWLDMKPEPGR
jgi:putative Holliday junction resolvase